MIFILEKRPTTENAAAKLASDFHAIDIRQTRKQYSSDIAEKAIKIAGETGLQASHVAGVLQDFPQHAQESIRLATTYKHVVTPESVALTLKDHDIVRTKDAIQLIEAVAPLAEIELEIQPYHVANLLKQYKPRIVRAVVRLTKEEKDLRLLTTDVADLIKTGKPEELDRLVQSLQEH